MKKEGIRKEGNNKLSCLENSITKTKKGGRILLVLRQLILKFWGIIKSGQVTPSWVVKKLEMSLTLPPNFLLLSTASP